MLRYFSPTCKQRNRKLSLSLGDCNMVYAVCVFREIVQDRLFPWAGVDDGEESVAGAGTQVA